MALKYHYQAKDIAYLKSQDLLLYQSWFPLLTLRFVNSSLTLVDTFRSQDVIRYYTPVQLEVFVSFSDMNKVMDKYDLEELPEAMAVFSVAVLEASGIPSDECKVEPDVIIKDFTGVDWRVTKVYKTDYLGHNKDEFIHYDAIIERNIRTNQDNPEDTKSSNYFYGSGDAALAMEDLYVLDFKNELEATYLFNPIEQKCYFVYPTSLGDLTDIQDENEVSDFAFWTLRTETFEDIDYNIYETDDLRNLTNQQYTFIR